MASFPLWANSLIVLVAVAIVGLGAHWVVEAASRIAKHLGISELVIGLTVVALGTSAPELTVTLVAAFEGHEDISVANVVGSNIFNLGFILGGCAIVSAIPTSRALVMRDGAFLALATLILLVFVGWDLKLERYEGVMLFVMLGLYLGYLFWQRRRGDDVDQDGVTLPEKKNDRPLHRDVALLLIGLVGVVGGAHFLVQSATAIARDIGVSEWAIGVTIVAAGTSTPEFATSVMGVIRGRYALSAGSVVGSDILNLVGVLGVAGMIRTLEVDPMARVSLVALTAMVALVLVFMRTGWRISRAEGLALVLVALVRWTFDLAGHSSGNLATG